MWRCGASVLMLSGLFVLSACEDRTTVPQELLQQQSDPSLVEQPAVPRPTTQELMEGHVPMTLDMLPLQMQVPSQWQITRHGSAGSIVWLEGPTPNGEAHIQLAMRNALDTREYELLLRGIRREKESDPQLHIEMRNTGPAQIVERRSLSTPISVPVVDEHGIPTTDRDGQPVMEIQQLMRWRVSVFVPKGEQVENYELNFIDLNHNQFEQDREFLEGLLGTLRYTGSAPAPATPEPTPEPGLR